ncbi:MAG TPA: hypothetical protein VHL77_07580 [Ferruginibacter sp.]|nr:hypothetical protein [Ferruginibacter sp.]
MPYIFLTVLVGLLYSCSPKNISTNYYYQNEKVLDNIEESFKRLSRKQLFTVGFTARDFETISLELITDTLSYVYEFNVSEPRLADTLTRFHLDATGVIDMIKQMQSIRCTWIKHYYYYVEEKKDSIIFMSIKPVALKRPFSYARYYVLSYFEQPQYFDSEGQLLDRRRLRTLRKINGEVFRRINNKVCYTISGNFR